MRLFLAGLLVIFMLPVAAFAQAKGQVLSVGFNNRYRPDCWTPMLIQITNPGEESTVYQIQIVQEDLDRDKVSFMQMETLGGTVEGKPAVTENFWVYFRPKPTERGLPDATNPSASLKTLNTQLKVFLCDQKGKQLTTLPMTSTIFSVDPYRSAGDPSRSRKMVLFVSDGADKPITPEYPMLKGILEDVDPVQVKPSELPSNVIGYEAVDAIVWMDADANFLTSGTRTPSLEALRQWVSQGGHLVVCEPPDPLKIKPFADLLPVAAIEQGEWTIPMADRKDNLANLRRIWKAAADVGAGGTAWRSTSSTFKVGKVPARQDAKVEEWMEWTDGPNTYSTPWLARRGYGLGVVTWVAQDLGNSALTSIANTDWRFIWDRVFGWSNAKVKEHFVLPQNVSDDPWLQSASLDLGYPLLHNTMDLTNKALSLLAAAGFFLLIYWGVAGPGTYFLLNWKKKAQYSWFFFGLSAIVATFLTVLLVKFLVRGPPELRHLSVVRLVSGQSDAVIDSRFGLYIPQDGPKEIELPDSSPHQVSYIAPYALNPQYAGDDDILPAYQEYQIPVRDPSETDPVLVTIPYRSSSKKLQTHWVGNAKTTIDVALGADIRLVPSGQGYIVGTLLNHTGYDLKSIYMGIKHPGPEQSNNASTESDRVWILYLPVWAKDSTLKLDGIMAGKNIIDMKADGRRPDGKDPAYGQLGQNFNQDPMDRIWQDKGDRLKDGAIEDVLPMLTFYDLMQPWRIDTNLPNHNSRAELFHRGARNLDLSAAVDAGELVICAVAIVNNSDNQTPLPVPLLVSGDRITGTGTTIFQCVVPVNRSAMYAPPPSVATTKPATTQRGQ